MSLEDNSLDKNDRPRERRKVGRPASGAQVQVQSLTRALSLLEQVSQSEHGMALSDLAEELNLAPSTAHRLLNALLQLGFLEFDADQNLWSVGVKTFSIGNAYLKKRDFVTQARPFMRELMLKSGETCNLAVIENDSVVFLSQVECSETMRMVARIGSRSPLHASGVGKAILSAMNEEEQDAIIKRLTLTKLTDRTISSRKALKQELERARALGYAIDDEEQKIGLRCLGANIYDENAEVIAGISISGPTVRITKEREEELAALVVDTVNRITLAIGGRRP